MIPTKILSHCENLLAASKTDDPCRQIDAFNALMNAVYEHDAHHQALAELLELPESYG